MTPFIPQSLEILYDRLRGLTYGQLMIKYEFRNVAQSRAAVVSQLLNFIKEEPTLREHLIREIEKNKVEKSS